MGAALAEQPPEPEPAALVAESSRDSLGVEWPLGRAESEEHPQCFTCGASR